MYVCVIVYLLYCVCVCMLCMCVLCVSLCVLCMCVLLLRSMAGQAWRPRPPTPLPLALYSSIVQMIKNCFLHLLYYTVLYCVVCVYCVYTCVSTYLSTVYRYTYLLLYVVYSSICVVSIPLPMYFFVPFLVHHTDTFVRLWEEHVFFYSLLLYNIFL